MKNIFKSVFLISSLFLITGCVKVEYTVGINDDKSVNMEVIYVVDESLTTEGNENISINTSEVKKDNYKYLEEKGWKVEEYTLNKDDKILKGVKLSKIYPNIDEITNKFEKKVTLTNIFNEEILFDDSQLFIGSDGRYKAKHIFDFTGEESIDYSEYYNMFDLSYKLTLPTPAIKNNASTVSEDKKTLTWNFYMGRVNEVEYEFIMEKEYNMKNLIISLVSLSILAIMSIVALIVKNKRDKNNKLNNNIENISKNANKEKIDLSIPVKEIPDEKQSIKDLSVPLPFN